MGQYIEYLRKSQMDRDFEELSVEETLKRHEQRLDEFTRQNKINVTVVLKEVVSGESLSSRPQMMKALELINTGEFDGIVCMDIDRLSRGNGMDSSYIMSVLQTNRCKIITPDKTYDLQNESDEQFADMKFMFSRYEFRTISKRLMNGRNTSASEGKYVGSVRPYGYEVVKLKGEKGNTLKIVPEEAKIVQMIFDLYTNERMGYNSIAHALNVIHLRTHTGRIWSQTSVLNVLLNETYMGKIRWKFNTVEKRLVDGKLTKKRSVNKDYEVHDGLHEAIISEEQWNLAKEIRTSRHNPSKKIGTEIVNPFAGIIKCEKCSSPLTWKTPRKGYTKTRYICKQSGKMCDCKGHVTEDVENIVVNEMKKWLNGYLIELNTDDTIQDNSLEVALDLLQKELEDLHEQQNNICELLETKVYTVQMFTKRNSALQTDIDRIESSIKDLKDQIFNQQKDKIVQNNIVPATQYLLDNYDMLTAKEKNDLWKEVLERITYYKAEKKGELYITIYPKLQQNSPKPNNIKG
jgi:DNA invertase Pin-like site-specific DNA recombinase